MSNMMMADELKAMTKTQRHKDTKTKTLAGSRPLLTTPVTLPPSSCLAYLTFQSAAISHIFGKHSHKRLFLPQTFFKHPKSVVSEFILTSRLCFTSWLQGESPLKQPLPFFSIFLFYPVMKYGNLMGYTHYTLHMFQGILVSNSANS